ncbi:MAG: DUF512 domain-containing protein, partial [Fibrobacterota bacterium]
MIKIINIYPGTPGFNSGLSAGDRIVSVNGNGIEDILDFIFQTSSETFLEFEYITKTGKKQKTVLEIPEGTFHGITVSSCKIKRCKNKCIFCFVDQQPPGLRPPLYIKDEDYRHSFLYGNYITGTSISKKDLLRIKNLRLSPLYISVHAVTPQIRQKLLGRRAPHDIIPFLRDLADSGINIHTQIVLCRGLNDGPELLKTLNTLYEMKSSVLSAAVVPAGLTKYRESLFGIKDYSPSQAARIIKAISSFRKRWSSVYPSDEFYLKAGFNIPGNKFYKDYPQLENGVGMIRQLMSEITVMGKMAPSHNKMAPLSVVSGYGAGKYVEKACRIISHLRKSQVRAYLIKNNFWGGNVDAAGLLTAEDIIRQLAGEDLKGTLILPSVCFNEDGLTLDGYSAEQI